VLTLATKVKKMADLITYLEGVNKSPYVVPADEAEWDAVYAAALSLKAAMEADGLGLSSRVLYCEPDGTVVVDTGKGASNTWANFQLKAINENHNTRPAIMFAQLSVGAYGAEEKNSTSVGKVQQYAAVRVGAASSTGAGAQFANQGTLRISRDA